MDVLYVALDVGGGSRYVLLDPCTVVYKHWQATSLTGREGTSFAKPGATANTAPHRLVTVAAASLAAGIRAKVHGVCWTAMVHVDQLLEMR